MTKERPPQFGSPRIDARALLGLYDPADATDWAPIRAAQLNAGAQLALFLVAANAVAAALIFLIFADAARTWPIASWGITVAAGATIVAFRRLAARQRTAVAATLQDVRGTLLDGVTLGLLWSVPAIVFAHGAPLPHILALWIVLSLLMTASAVAMAALPLATLGFLAILGSAVAVCVWLAAGALMAVAVLFFTVLLMVGCFARAKALVVIRAQEIGIAERDETVSLLLHEFEDKAADWLWETDAARQIVRASPRFAYATGHDPLTINGMNFLQLLAGPAWESGNLPAGLHLLAEKLKAREAFRELRLPVHVKGEQRWWEIAASPRIDDEGKFLGFRGVGSDVTDQRASADKISRMARFDTLTGMPNRLQINEALSHAMAEAEKWSGRCAFMMIDLDRFKAINDTLGHPCGDRLLGRVSERLATLVTTNEMIGRLGGDEFAVVVRDASDTAHLEALAQRIIATLSQPYEVDGNTLHIGASVGLAIGPRDGRATETLMRSADLALYRSKDAGGGVFHTYEPNLHVVAEERRVLEMALRRALDAGEFALHYQPVVSAETGGLVGFEALLRWESADFGQVPPAKFIPLAEEARLIGPIGEWVLRTACAEAASWPTPTRIAVNVSTDQLASASFVAVVAQALAQSGLAPERLELEVTESVFMKENGVAPRVLERLAGLGVQLSLDDFGTGYSSLGYLSRSRFSTIKIDRRFIGEAANGGREAIAIIRAVVALACSLGMTTTAEGIETEGELRLVQDLGCAQIQGFYFSRPLPVEDARQIAHRASQLAA